MYILKPQVIIAILYSSHTHPPMDAQKERNVEWGGGGASLKEDFEINFLFIYIYANFEGVGGLACDRCQKGAIPLHWSLFTSAFTAANEGHKILSGVKKAWA